MKFIGWMMSAGFVATATAALAQPAPPREIGRPAITATSDIEGPYAAMPPPRQRRYVPEATFAPAVLSPREISAIARDEGFAPLGIPRQRGMFYTLAAINPDGDDGRLVIDGRSGRLVRFMPAWRMGAAMEEETLASYGPVQGLPPLAEGRPPRPPRSVPHLASRTPTTPLPRPSPQQSTKGPSPAAASNAAAAVTPGKDASKPNTDAPRQESATVQDKPAAAPAPTPTEAKPSTPPIQPTEPMPPVQGLE
ncbi:hypothetical protein [Rhodopseudomonas pseudopalustris]|uniref:Peptidase propeptide and YPEB domain-containing protein n=1 Tax=Rhodopseudomonas pseudopalustris TaxID=1513892 RepID=A0A1H8TV37_9BRAD|nr:hypothetical protein [Rhodopseudomonas pseudopalustris]SEO94705.1 hypothetical protein SAMN05444123_106136 [Rhodopseudomonas pseudopalustris]